MSNGEIIVLKRGPLSADEKEYIKVNHKRMTVSEIAKACSRNEDPIKKYMVDNKLTVYKIEDTSDRKMIKDRLENEFFWPAIVRSVTDEELEFFVAAWVEYMEQFNEDITTAEKSQTKQLIMFEILKNRSSFQLNRANRRSQEIDEELQIERLKPNSTRDDQRIGMLQNELAMIRTDVATYQTQIEKYNKACQDLYKDLKATRDQRFKQVENGETTFSSIIKELSDARKRRNKGLELELLKMGADKSEEIMSEYHMFADGNLDIPILNAENYLKRKKHDQTPDEGK